MKKLLIVLWYSLNVVASGHDYFLLNRLLASSNVAHSQVQQVMQSPEFKNFDVNMFAIVLRLAIRFDYVDLVSHLLLDDRYQKIPTRSSMGHFGEGPLGGDPYQSFSKLMLEAVRSSVDIVKILIKDVRFQQQTTSVVNTLYEVAKDKLILHVLKAYTALKPEYQKYIDKSDNTFAEPELMKYPVGNMLAAYKEFLIGNPNNLHNLIFPVSQNILAVFPVKRRLASSIHMISQALRQLFKQDSIKSLVITLSQTSADIDYALNDLLLPMELVTQEEVAKVKAKIGDIRSSAAQPVKSSASSAVLSVQSGQVAQQVASSVDVYAAWKRESKKDDEHFERLFGRRQKEVQVKDADQSSVALPTQSSVLLNNVIDALKLANLLVR